MLGCTRLGRAKNDGPVAANPHIALIIRKFDEANTDGAEGWGKHCVSSFRVAKPSMDSLPSVFVFTGDQADGLPSLESYCPSLCNRVGEPRKEISRRHILAVGLGKDAQGLVHEQRWSVVALAIRVDSVQYRLSDIATQQVEHRWRRRLDGRHRSGVEERLHGWRAYNRRI